MKTKTLLFATLALCASVAISAVRPITLTDGINPITAMTLPTGSARLIGYETIMARTNDNGSTALTLGRTVRMKVDTTDVYTTTETNTQVVADTLVDNYYIGAIYAQQAGYDDLVHNAVFSNHYGNSTKSKYVGPQSDIFSRITLKVNNGVKTTTQPTNFFLQVTFGDTVNFYTNFVWDISGGNLTMHERAHNPALTVRLYRDEYSMKYATNTTVVTTTHTNRWVDTVSRSVPIAVAPSVTTTNGYSYTAAPADTYILAGDRLDCTSPVATNKPGVVRVLISEP